MADAPLSAVPPVCMECGVELRPTVWECPQGHVRLPSARADHTEQQFYMVPESHVWEIEPNPYSDEADVLLAESESDAWDAVTAAAEQIFDAIDGGEERVIKIRCRAVKTIDPPDVCSACAGAPGAEHECAAQKTPAAPRGTPINEGTCACPPTMPVDCDCPCHGVNGSGVEGK